MPRSCSNFDTQRAVLRMGTTLLTHSAVPRLTHFPAEIQLCVLHDSGDNDEFFQKKIFFLNIRIFVLNQIMLKVSVTSV